MYTFDVAHFEISVALNHDVDGEELFKIFNINKYSFINF